MHTFAAKFLLLGVGVVTVMTLMTLTARNDRQVGFTHPVGLAPSECTITLTPDESIQGAIQSASSRAVICLTEGTWKESLTIQTGSLTLRGTAPETTVLDGNGSGTGIGIKNKAQVVIEGLTIRNFSTGVVAESSAKIGVADSTVSGNDSGLMLGSSVQAIITGNRITRNTAYGVVLIVKGCGFAGGAEIFT